uniref:NHL domain-containing protein n=1 Tax=Chenopodium quinoa TaxID=63459 RepID=A0A803N1H9_CHEQI
MLKFVYPYVVNDSRPKLVAGSPEGYSGHVDGKYREARLNHPKGVAVDDRGNIYVANTMNMAIRKISDPSISETRVCYIEVSRLIVLYVSRVTTIAGGKWSNRGGHVDGPSDEAKFSNDFDVVYVGSSCSLPVIDRGNRAIREIHQESLEEKLGNKFPMLKSCSQENLQKAGRSHALVSILKENSSLIHNPKDAKITENTSSSPYQKPLKSVKPPLIPTEDDTEK